MSKRKIDYSEGERRALEALEGSEGKRLSTLDLVRKVYGDDPPFHARHSIVGTMRSLSAKVERNRERFRVAKSKRAGSRPAVFSIERREGA